VFQRCPVLECRHEGTREDIGRHLQIYHPQVGGAAAATLNIFPFVEIRAFRGYLRTYRHRESAGVSIITPGDYFNRVERSVFNIFNINTVGNRSIKMQVSLVCEFMRGDEGTPSEERVVHFMNSKMNIMHNTSEFDEIYSRIHGEINQIIEIFEEHGSGWKVKRILGSDVRIAKYRTLRGGCFIEIPSYLQQKRAIINVRNNDTQCFKWSFLSIMHYNDVNSKHRNRVSSYRKFESKYDFSCINFPVSMRSITKFELKNQKKKLAINIFEQVEHDDLMELTIKRISPFSHEKGYKCVDMLLLHDENLSSSHYTGIVDLGKLYGQRNYHKKQFCYNCLHFIGKKSFMNHATDCNKFKTQKVKMPSPKVVNNVLLPPEIKFKNQHKDIPHEYVMYLDFECLMDSVANKDNTCNTFMLAQHKPTGF